MRVEFKETESKNQENDFTRIIDVHSKNSIDIAETVETLMMKIRYERCLFTPFGYFEGSHSQEFLGWNTSKYGMSLRDFVKSLVEKYQGDKKKKRGRNDVSDNRKRIR
jgi:hypothetical protein